MMDSADPLDGWQLAEILQGSYGAKDDLYGQFYMLVKNHLMRFCEKLSALEMDINLFQVDAEHLSSHIHEVRGSKTFYDRIEVRTFALCLQNHPH